MLNISSPIIFIIDPEKAHQHILRNCFMALGYKKIFTFSSPEECVKCSKKADVIITEQQFDNCKIDGTDFMWAYRCQYPAAHFFFYTKDTSVESAGKALQQGAVDYFHKGLKGLEVLVTSVENFILSRKRKIQSLTDNLIAV